MITEPIPRPEVAYRLMHRRSQHRSFQILQAQQAENLIDSIRKSGGFLDQKGNGIVWRDGDNEWTHYREINEGQWFGPWTREKIDNTIQEIIL